MRRALSLEPNPRYLLKFGVLLEESGDLDGAMVALRPAYEDLAGAADALLALGRVLLKRGQGAEVQQLYERAIKSEPANRARYLADQERLERDFGSGSPQQPSERAGKASPPPPVSPVASSQPATVSGIAAPILAVIAQLEAAIKADPKNSRLHRDLSVRYVRAGRLADAKEQTRLAEQLRAQRTTE